MKGLAKDETRQKVTVPKTHYVNLNNKHHEAKVIKKFVENKKSCTIRFTKTLTHIKLALKCMIDVAACAQFRMTKASKVMRVLRIVYE